MKNVILKISTVFAFQLTAFMSIAQVGINNPLPDASAVLDLSGGANEGKGLLLPQTTNVIGVPTPARGLIVFDSVSNEAYIHNADSSKWYSMNPFKKEIGINTIFTNYDLNLQSNLTVANTTVFNAGITVNGNSQLNGNVTSTGAVTTSSYFSGNGAVPPGAIMMWSGSIADIPDGWALCDGNFYNPDGSICTGFCQFFVNTIKSPDLRGKFIVGYDPADADYDQIVIDQGGEKEHLLTTSELPSHTHGFSGTTSTNGNHTHSASGSTPFTDNLGNKTPGASWGGGPGYSNVVANAGNHNHTFSGTTDTGTGNGQPHENRPPYMTLAYIIKLKVTP